MVCDSDARKPIIQEILSKWNLDDCYCYCNRNIPSSWALNIHTWDRCRWIYQHLFVSFQRPSNSASHCCYFGSFDDIGMYRLNIEHWTWPRVLLFELKMNDRREVMDECLVVPMATETLSISTYVPRINWNSLTKLKNSSIRRPSHVWYKPTQFQFPMAFRLHNDSRNVPKYKRLRTFYMLTFTWALWMNSKIACECTLLTSQVRLNIWIMINI